MICFACINIFQKHISETMTSACCMVLTCRCLSRAWRIFLRSHWHLAVTMAMCPRTLSSLCKQQNNKSGGKKHAKWIIWQSLRNFKQRFRTTVPAPNAPMKTYLAQNELHITELTVLPQLAIIFVESTFWVAWELQSKISMVSEDN